MNKFLNSFYLIFSLLCCFKSIHAQDIEKLCKAVAKENFSKVERLVKKEICKRKHGTEFYNGPGSGNQITHQYNLDTLTLWLRNQSCIEDAAWDKCQEKIDIYPGFSSIGVKFKTPTGIVEKCFFIQEGTTGNINIFGWRCHLFKAKNILVYKKMYECNGFVDKQKIKCAGIKK